MRTLKYAILGLINREPMTGYDITREFNSNNLANFWYAKHSQVYPELGRLMDEKLVTCEVVIQGEKLEKKLYSITPDGRAQLQEWLMKNEPLEPTPKDVFRLRMYFSDFMTPKELKTQLTLQLEKHILKKKYLTDIMHRLPPLEPGSSEISWCSRGPSCARNLTSHGFRTALPAVRKKKSKEKPSYKNRKYCEFYNWVSFLLPAYKAAFLIKGDSIAENLIVILFVILFVLLCVHPVR